MPAVFIRNEVSLPSSRGDPNSGSALLVMAAMVCGVHRVPGVMLCSANRNGKQQQFTWREAEHVQAEEAE